MKQLPAALQPLAQYRQFIIWIIRNGQKFPFNPYTMKVADAHDPDVQMSADEALATAELFGPGYYVGFVFTKNDPFFFIDIDKCYSPATGWSPTALEVLALFPGAAVEVSFSNTGLHIIGSGACPAHGCKNATLGLELYTEKRFIALTGTHAAGNAAADFSAALPAVVAKYFPISGTVADRPSEFTNVPVEGYSSTDTDDQLIERAMRSSSAGAVLGNKATFANLWTGDETALHAAYPDNYGSRPYDASTADAALAQHLMFWTGGNCERVQALMERSGLRREKWDRQGDDYLRRTIIHAASKQKQYYSVRPPREVTPSRDSAPGRDASSGPNEPATTIGYQYLNASAQEQFFKGCVYVQDIDRIFVPTGDFLKSSQFNAMFGGYVFQIDEIGEKTTRKAWEAFTENQAIRFPKAHTACFRPSAAPGAVITEEGRIMVNSYVPIPVESKQGDIGPFMDHVNRILPNKNDQTILLSYMAACVQHAGVKFQWAPLLQGVEGNGKTFFTRCVAHAVGTKYRYYPKARELDGKFNAWMPGKLFYGVEDIYVPSHRQDIIEALKPMITNDTIEIEMKGVDQFTAEVCGNFMLNANKKDAILKTRNDRRFAVFFTRQQEATDLQRDGMTGEYFPKLYAWLRADGYAIVTHFLKTYQIPEQYNPATLCHRAPETSSTTEAIAAGLGSVEQGIMEAVSEGRLGFCGGWVSSVALDKLLKENRQERFVPINKRRELLQSLGYDWHPILAGQHGRVNNPTTIDDGKKPCLYIKQGSLKIGNLRTAADVLKQYESDQRLSGASDPTAAEIFASG